MWNILTYMYLYMANETYNQQICRLFLSKTLKTDKVLYLQKILVIELLFKNMFKQLNIKPQKQFFFLPNCKVSVYVALQKVYG